MREGNVVRVSKEQCFWGSTTGGFFARELLSHLGSPGEQEQTIMNVFASALPHNALVFDVLDLTRSEDAIRNAARELGALRTRVLELERKVESLSRRLDDLVQPGMAVITLREIPRSQAKDEIRALFAGGEVLDYGDVAERLALDLQLVVEVCGELEREGVIGEYAGSAETR